MQLEEEATHLEARAHQLRGTIRSLWERLEVPQDHRDAFSQLYTGHKPKIIASVRISNVSSSFMCLFVLRTVLILMCCMFKCVHQCTVTSTDLYIPVISVPMLNCATVCNSSEG